MSRSRDLPRPENPLRSPIAIIFLALLVIVPLVLGVRWLEKQNKKHQVERRIEEQPQLKQEVERLKKLIAANEAKKPTREEAAQNNLAVALWIGEVKEYKETPPPSKGLMPTITLKLSEPILLAGTKGKTDTPQEIQISLKNRYWRAGDEPAKGEHWIVAVWRDTSANNILHTAAPAGK